jgi:hypothetical protein
MSLKTRVAKRAAGWRMRRVDEVEGNRQVRLSTETREET